MNPALFSNPSGPELESCGGKMTIEGEGAPDIVPAHERKRQAVGELTRWPANFSNNAIADRSVAASACRISRVSESYKRLPRSAAKE